MPSTLTTDVAAPRSGGNAPDTVARRAADDLLVLWQYPDTREIAPVGRLRRVGSLVEFAYTVGASRVRGFRPLPGLPDLERRYTSRGLPAVFERRVLSPSRPDYVGRMGQLGLDPGTATPWEQIVRSGGRRQGDTLQVMPTPRVCAGRAYATFLGNGVRWIPRNDLRVDGVPTRVSETDQERALARLTAGDRVRVARDVDNSHDANACLVLADQTPVARVPRVLAPAFRELLAVGQPDVRVLALGEPSGPAHLRLTLTLDTPAPAGFQLDRAGAWEPLVAWES